MCLCSDPERAFIGEGGRIASVVSVHRQTEILSLDYLDDAGSASLNDECSKLEVAESHSLSPS